MSHSDIPKARLVVDLGGAGGEVEVLDAALRVVDIPPHAIAPDGSVHLELEPGLYRVRTWTGSAPTTRDVVLTPAANEHVSFHDARKWRTAVPMASAVGVDEAQARFAAELSTAPPDAGPGTGASLFVFVRGHPDGSRPSDMPTRLALHDPMGRRCVDFDELPSCRDAFGCRGFHVTASPGIWRLRLPDPAGGARELALLLAPGWQTQVFLLWRERSGGWRPSLTRAAVLMGDRFRPESHLHDDAAQAIDALGRGRYLRGRPVLNLLYGKWEDPLLAIYAGWNIVRAARDGRDTDGLQRLTGAIQRMHGLLDGPHDMPDVHALRLAANPAALDDLPDGAFAHPPMIADAWDVMLAASVARPGLVPAGSLTERISDRLIGSGTYLVWRIGRSATHRASAPSLRAKRDLPPAEAVVGRAHEVREALAARALDPPTRANPRRPDLVGGPETVGRVKLDEVEARVVQALAGPERPSVADDAKALVRRVGTPLGRVALALDTLAAKLVDPRRG